MRLIGLLKVVAGDIGSRLFISVEKRRRLTWMLACGVNVPCSNAWTASGISGVEVALKAGAVLGEGSSTKPVGVTERASVATPRVADGAAGCVACNTSVCEAAAVGLGGIGVQVADATGGRSVEVARGAAGLGVETPRQTPRAPAAIRHKTTKKKLRWAAKIFSWRIL